MYSKVEAIVSSPAGVIVSFVAALEIVVAAVDGHANVFAVLLARRVCRDANSSGRATVAAAARSAERAAWAIPAAGLRPCRRRACSRPLSSFTATWKSLPAIVVTLPASHFSCSIFSADGVHFAPATDAAVRGPSGTRYASTSWPPRSLNSKARISPSLTAWPGWIASVPVERAGTSAWISPALVAERPVDFQFREVGEVVLVFDRHVDRLAGGGQREGGFLDFHRRVDLLGDPELRLAPPPAVDDAPGGIADDAAAAAAGRSSRRNGSACLRGRTRIPGRARKTDRRPSTR